MTRKLLPRALGSPLGVGYPSRVMVAPADRDHFRRIAEAEAEMNREAVLDSASRSPGENIALGFALSEFAAAFGADLTRADEVSPARLWRERVACRTAP